jgi:Ethanolamine utilization protein EutJ (predicted chaperonin)
MITALKQKVTIKPGGLVSLRSSRLKAGTQAEVIVLVEPAENPVGKSMTGADLLKSGLVGMWAGRKEFADSLEFARELRDKAEKRSQ